MNARDAQDRDGGLPAAPVETVQPDDHAVTVAAGPAPGLSAADAAAALDSSIQAAQGRLGGGLSPISLGLAWADWAWHLAGAPGTASRLGTEAAIAAWQALQQAADSGPPAERRYADPAWAGWPFRAQAALHGAAERWWQEATALRGMSPHHRDVVQLFARQWLDMLAPSNWLWSNPQVLQRALQTQGGSLLRGAAHAVDDWRRSQGLPTLENDGPQYRPGIEVACTPGEVVHRNHLIELIQYTPRTPQVQREPVFIVPSWIMKYYILDLSPHNSMARYLVEQGHTVFMLSWRNPDEGDALLDMQDYLQLGIFDALAAITRLTGGVPIHTAGYCLGGTLLAIGAAALARPQSVPGAETLAPLASMTLLAAQIDFRDPGDLGVLIDDAQVAMLEDTMAERGFLTGRQMAGSFQFLHAQDLVWSVRMHEYLLGEPILPNDLMAWNADVTRMPATMHSHYLRSLYLHNDLAEGRYEVDGRPVSLHDVQLPIFAVGTLKDHVSPWRSAFKVQRLTHTDVDFVLTSGGHNAGIVSEPGHAGRSYQRLLTRGDDPQPAPDDWQRQAPRFEGSWWPAWHDWLVAHGSGTVPARSPRRVPALGPAPGTYVQVRYND
jgi:polyhydroxyalkanoate synthase